jgi:hypothetical protein
MKPSLTGLRPRPHAPRQGLDKVAHRIRAVAAVVVLSLATLGVVAVVGSAQAADTLLSQGKTATASSTEDTALTPARAAVDGQTGSRWASAFSDPQWLQVDLGATASISSVVLNWETAYAKAFQIQTSADATNWTSIYSTTTGTGGVQTLNVTGSGRYVRMYGTARATGYGYSLFEFQVYGSFATMPTMPGMPTTPAAFNPNLDPGESITVNPAVVGKVPDPNFVYPPDTYHYEFQANCAPTRNLPDDPIVFPGQPGASHMHTFMGSTVTTATSTDGQLLAGGTSCVTPQDKSGYWFPTMYNGTTAIQPSGPQVIYYKSDVTDYRTVQPFPKGLRFVVGSPSATQDQFQNSPGAVEGWECGDSSKNWDFPATCAAGTQLNVRMQSPSCWDGVHLDSADHKSHMSYPVLVNNKWVCPSDHPVALPMIEFKMAFPVSGDMSQVHLSSGRGYSWHYDFFNGWDPTILAPLVHHCINGGLQCNPRGFDLYKPQAGGVLDENYQLIPGVS